ncbi:hypothetical protein ACIQ7S_03705 [Streptomyces griseoluteus]|uniref:hypothetical protein n=1 Tax=Streptomyces griseoluteus TaxID=29306 RepID=UPI003327BB7D
MTVDEDFMAGPSGPKTKAYASVPEILAKLEGKAAMWARVARDNKERSEDFEQAAQKIRDGATAVTVGRTTYTLTNETRAEAADESAS